MKLLPVMLAVIVAASPALNALAQAHDGEAGKLVRESSAIATDWAQKVGQKIKMRIAFDPRQTRVDPNATVEFEVRLLPDGSTAAIRLTKSSGIPAFDAAVMRAIEASEPYPADASGKVPKMFTSSHRLGP